MALLALLPAAGSFLAQTALGAGLAAGTTVVAPQLSNLMGGNVNWRLNPDSKSDDDRVIEIDSKGNKTFKPLDNNNVKYLFQGGWEGLRANAKERQQKLERERALGKMEARSNRQEARADQGIQMQLQDMRNRQDLMLAEMNLKGQQIQQQGDIAQRADQREGERLDMQRDQNTTLAQEAQANRFDNRVNQNNQIEATLYNNRLKEANDSYEMDINRYNQAEARRSAPGRTLMNLGAMLAGGRF
jgi:hypothetical protein